MADVSTGSIGALQDVRVGDQVSARSQDSAHLRQRSRKLRQNFDHVATPDGVDAGRRFDEVLRDSESDRDLSGQARFINHGQGSLTSLRPTCQ